LATNRNAFIIDIPLSVAGDPLGLPHAYIPKAHLGRENWHRSKKIVWTAQRIL
jgi:hypothetical protein